MQHQRLLPSLDRSTPSLDISRELLGVFWLTYFNSRYCEFFGRDRVSSLEQVTEGPAGGITLQLAEAPGQTPEDQRLILEKKLGAESFAGTGDQKARGQYALTLEQLSSATKI